MAFESAVIHSLRWRVVPQGQTWKTYQSSTTDLAIGLHFVFGREAGIIM